MPTDAISTHLRVILFSFLRVQASTPSGASLVLAGSCHCRLAGMHGRCCSVLCTHTSQQPYSTSSHLQSQNAISKLRPEKHDHPMETIVTPQGLVTPVHPFSGSLVSHPRTFAGGMSEERTELEHSRQVPTLISSIHRGDLHVSHLIQSILTAIGSLNDARRSHVFRLRRHLLRVIDQGVTPARSTPPPPFASY